MKRDAAFRGSTSPMYRVIGTDTEMDRERKGPKWKSGEGGSHAVVVHCTVQLRYRTLYGRQTLPIARRGKGNQARAGDAHLA